MIMEIIRYIIFLSLFLRQIQANAAEPSSAVTTFTADSVQIFHSIFNAQYSLLLILLVIGVIWGALWRRRFHIEDIGWIIVVITLSLGFACVLLRVKLGT
jgi:hypothetical protein